MSGALGIGQVRGKGVEVREPILTQQEPLRLKVWNGSSETVRHRAMIAQVGGVS